MNQLLSTLDTQFAALHERASALVRLVPADKLYWQPGETAHAFPVFSCGEHLLRSAACVEQTFGGISVNLWDDPFEWALPETLSTPSLVAEYLAEVEATRRRGLASLHSDGDLLKEIAMPSGERQTLFALLCETLVRAAHHQGRAFATFHLFSHRKLPTL